MTPKEEKLFKELLSKGKSIKEISKIFDENKQMTDINSFEEVFGKMFNDKK